MIKRTGSTEVSAPSDREVALTRAPPAADTEIDLSHDELVPRRAAGPPQHEVRLRVRGPEKDA